MLNQTLTTPKPRILAVDDDPDILRLIELTLGRAGYEVAVAQDGPAALAYVNAEHPDVMLLDLWMPVMDGFSVLDELSRLDRSPRVVCLTGKTDTEGRERAWKLGVDDYVTKPFHLARVLEVLRTVRASDASMRQSRRRTALDTLSWT